MDNLPIEVYYRIFLYLSRPEIRTCSFVCKRLNMAAVQVYNKMLIIDDYKARMARFNLASDNIDKFFKEGHLVRKLIIKSERKDPMKTFLGSVKEAAKIEGLLPIFSQKEFLLLLRHLPNIEEIDFTKSGSFKYYVSYLSGASLRHIKNITTLWFECPISFVVGYHEYFSTCFRFRDTLTSVCFMHTDSPDDYIYNGIDVIERLGHFKNLKQLVFRNKCSDNRIMFRIPQTFPQLEELIYRGKLVFLKEVVRNSSNLKSEPFVKLNKNLRRLHIALGFLSIDCTKYLTSYLGNGIHQLNIRVAFDWLYDWIADIGMEDALKLFKRLGQLNEVCIYFVQAMDHRRRSLAGDLKITKWYQLVNAFKGNKKGLCTVRYFKSRILRDYFKYNSLDNQFIFTYTLEDEGFLEELEEDDANHLNGSLSASSIVGPKIIDRLELKLRPQEEALTLKFLKYAFTNCINLQYLEVENYLWIQGFRNRKSSQFGGIQDNLKMIHFICGAPTCDMLNLISANLLNIEVLVFGSHSTDNLTLNLTEFKSLKQSYFVIQDISEPLSFKFEYINGKIKSYYYDRNSVSESKHGINNSCRAITFTCKGDIDFTVYLGSNESLLSFDIDAHQDNCYRITSDLI